MQKKLLFIRKMMTQSIQNNRAYQHARSVHTPLRTCALALFVGAIALLLGCPDNNALIGTDTIPPPEITNLSAVGGDKNIMLSWEKPMVTDFAKVVIRWEPGNGVAEVHHDASPDNRYTVSGLANDTEYTVTIQSVDRDSNASVGIVRAATPAAINPAAPAAVSAVTATAVDGQVALAWTNPGDSDLAKIAISWTPNDGAAEVLAGATPNSSYIVSGLANAVAYLFTITAVDTMDTAAPALTISATPRAPLSLALDVTSDGITLASGESKLFLIENLSHQKAYRLLLNKSVGGTIAIAKIYDGTSDISAHNRLSGVSPHSSGIGATYFPYKERLFLPGRVGNYLFEVYNSHASKQAKNTTLVIGAYTTAPRMITDGVTRYGNPNFATADTYYYVAYTLGLMDTLMFDDAYDDAITDFSGIVAIVNPRPPTDFNATIFASFGVISGTAPLLRPESSIMPQVFFIECDTTIVSTADGNNTGLFFTVSAPY